jgi:hypothetical protein
MHWGPHWNPQVSPPQTHRHSVDRDSGLATTDRGVSIRCGPPTDPPAMSVLAFREVSRADTGPRRAGCRHAPPTVPGRARARRQTILAFSTGLGAGAASTFVLVKDIYERAEAQCEAADARIVELRRLQGVNDETPRRQVCPLSRRAHALRMAHLRVLLGSRRCAAHGSPQPPRPPPPTRSVEPVESGRDCRARGRREVAMMERRGQCVSAARGGALQSPFWH